MQYLQHLLENSQFPFFSAFILGLMTAISPCPLATNITAIGFISRDIENKRIIFRNGLIYTLGRTFSYTALGLVFYFGASKFHVSAFFQIYGEMLIGPMLIIIGILMFDFIRLNLPGFGNLSSKIGAKKKPGSALSAFLLGIVFALAFCPYSGVLYFGMLIPMTISGASGLYLPAVFAMATGIPVIIVAYLLAYSISGIGSFFNKMRSFETWFRKIVAVTFIIAGFYYSWNYFVF